MLAAMSEKGLSGVPQETAQETKADGYRGIWYMNQPSGDAYVYKYSGGFATYPQQHVPIAIHAPRVGKTFFCYGGTVPGKQELLIMVSYFDHATHTVPRPTILLNKQTDDAHDNPTLALDTAGYLWVFSNAHGTERPAFIHKSRKPYSIDSFEKIVTTNFSYGQPWHLGNDGFLFLHTRYGGGRGLFWMTSRDGVRWSEPRPLAKLAQGHYQISWPVGGSRVATVFDYHPPEGGLNARTNLYYLETPDAGKTWRTVSGEPVATPLTQVRNAALVHNYEAEKRLVYLKDLQFDKQGHPVVLYLTSKGYASGPANDPRTWKTARWTGRAWERRPVTTSDHNYDHGSLYIEENETWRIIAPTLPGPQPYCTGGEVAVWITRDEGESWKLEKQLTTNSPRNHTYCRRPLNAHPDFYALWADGDAKKPSESYLYFTNRAGDRVWRLPPTMTADTARPEVIR